MSCAPTRNRKALQRTAADVKRDPRPLGWLFVKKFSRQESEKHMHESIILRPGDSNEVCTAKLMLQIDYYAERNQLDNIKACLAEGVVTANEVLSARDI